MMDREQIMRALEQCANDYQDCHNCPYGKIGVEKNCFDVLKRDTLTLIKELSEENENLRATVAIADGERKCRFDVMRKSIAKAKADTVRKMKSEIEDRCIKGGIYPAFIARTIDQIAKEMLEGEE